MTPLDQLGAGRGEEERLGVGAELDRPVLEDLADPLAHRRPARLAHRDGALGEGVAEHPRLGRLPGAVDSLEGHEQSRHLRRRR